MQVRLGCLSRNREVRESIAFRGEEKLEVKERVWCGSVANPSPWKVEAGRL